MGFSEDDFRWLPEPTARRRVGMTPNFGAIHARHCAALHPARLAQGLAETVSRLGVRLVEQCPVLDYAPGRLTTRAGTLAAGTVIRATEAYTGGLPGHGRDLLPLYSMMVATEPLPASLWDAIGLSERETFGDDRRVVIYGQRTLDGRLAFGGRAGYRFGSRRYRVVPPGLPDLDRVTATLRGLFPVLENVAITHRWGGVLGVPRHWRPCVAFDPATRVGWAGGYIGEGVAASNLAARALADLILERTSELTALPWVGDLPRRWEPEPLRWLGASTLQWLAERADRSEFRRGRPSRVYGSLFRALTG
jgi:glycine/D-amino acid oxidase-like deaminating enzyme